MGLLEDKLMKIEVKDNMRIMWNVPILSLYFY